MSCAHAARSAASACCGTTDARLPHPAEAPQSSTQPAVRCRRRAKVKLHAFHQPALFCPCEGCICEWRAQRPSGAATQNASRAGHTTGSSTGVASTTAVLPACCQRGKSRHVSQAGHRRGHVMASCDKLEQRALEGRGAARASAAARYSADVHCACSGSAVSAHAACAVQVNRLQ